MSLMDNHNVQKENINHGDALFPLHVYHLDMGFERQILSCHWHEEVEVIYMKRGKAIFQIDTSGVEICSGQAVFINSQSLHSGYSSEGEHCEFYAVVFKLAMLNSHLIGLCQSEFIRPLINNQIRFPIKVYGKDGWEQDIINQIHELIQAFEQKMPGYELCITGCLYKLFFILIKNHILDKNKNKDIFLDTEKIERVKKVLEYIHANYKNQINISDLANVLNMSTYHFCRFFKYMTGQTSIEYINSYRVRKAIELMPEVERKLLDISMEVGFNNVSYFIRVFKGLMGCTPIEFRKLQK